MWSTATFVDHMYTIKITQLFKQLGVPLTVICTCAASEPAHYSGHCLLPKKVDIPCLHI